MCVGNGTAESVLDIHATGVPDTPIECITDYLSQALKTEKLSDVKSLVQKALDIAGGLDPYLERISSKPPKVLSQLLDASASHDWTAAYEQGKTQFHQKKECCAGHLEGRLMKMLVRMLRAKNVLEVGMFTGTSTLAMAEAVPDDGKVVALEIEPYLRDFAAPFFQQAGLADKIEVLVGPALSSMQQLSTQGQSFDIAFLDADKGGYLSYYKYLMDTQLLAPQGIVVVDNALMKGRVYAPGGIEDSMADAIREFNEFVAADDRVEVVCLPFRDGVSLVCRKPISNGDVVQTGLHQNSILQRFKLTNKVAMITGAGQGIGRAFAHALGEAGAAVAVVDLDAAKAEQVAGELIAKGVRAVAIQGDVTEQQDCDRIVGSTVERLGGLHIGVNNAGINRNSAAEDTPIDEWDATFAVNTRGVFMCCQAQARHMLENGIHGSIINTASMATLLVPHPQKQIAYNCSKAAVVKMTQTMAAEWADRGIRVNCISPGIVNTALIHESPDLKPLVSEWLSQIPSNRLAEVTDLQAAIVYMASDAAGYMTGHNLVVEGGQSLW